jgi:hypothetical protein
LLFVIFSLEQIFHKSYNSPCFLPSGFLILPPPPLLGQNNPFRNPVKANSLDIGPPSVDVDLSSLDIDSSSVDIDPPSVDVDPPSVDVDLSSVDVDLPSLDINPLSLAINPKSVDHTAFWGKTTLFELPKEV